VRFAVAAQLVLAVKVPPAYLANVCTLDVVGFAMLGKIGRLAELFTTHLALKGLLSGMCPLVHGQSTLLLESLIAARYGTTPRFFARVRSHMLLKRLLR
jgi:hypothetical protein